MLAGFFSLDPIKNLAHEMESVFGRMRSGELASSPEIVSLLLEANSRLSEMIGNIREVDRVDTSSLIKRLGSLASGERLTFTVNELPVAPEAPRRASESAVELRRPDGSVAFVVDADRLKESQQSRQGGRYVHWLTARDALMSRLEDVSVVLDGLEVLSRFFEKRSQCFVFEVEHDERATVHDRCRRASHGPHRGATFAHAPGLRLRLASR